MTPPTGQSSFDQREVARFETRKARRGFASMSAEKRRESAGKGGRVAHTKGVAPCRWYRRQALLSHSIWPRLPVRLEAADLQRERHHHQQDRAE